MVSPTTLTSLEAAGSDASTDPDLHLDIPLGLRRKSAGPLRRTSSLKGAAARKPRAQRPSVVPPSAAASAPPSVSTSGDDHEGMADQSVLESHTYPSATPSDVGSEQSHAQGSPHRLHPQSETAAAEEAARLLLIPEQHLSAEAGAGADALQDFDPFAAEEIVVPISERVKRAKRKPPAPAYASLVDEPQPKKKKKKRKMKPLLQQHELPMAGGRNGGYHPAASAHAANREAAMNQYPLGHFGLDKQPSRADAPAHPTTRGNNDAAAAPSASRGLHTAGDE